jgi:hypothetical protein
MIDQVQRKTIIHLIMYHRESLIQLNLCYQFVVPGYENYNRECRISICVGVISYRLFIFLYF